MDRPLFKIVFVPIQTESTHKKRTLPTCTGFPWKCKPTSVVNFITTRFALQEKDYFELVPELASDVSLASGTEMESVR